MPLLPDARHVRSREETPTSFAIALARALADRIYVVGHAVALRLATCIFPAWLLYYAALGKVRLLLVALSRRPLQRRLVCFAVLFNLLLWPGPGLLTRDAIATISVIVNTLKTGM